MHLLQNLSLTLKEIAAGQQFLRFASRHARLPRPDIVTAILNGRHSAQLTANRLMEDTRLPLEWKAQRELFRLV